MTGCPEGQVGEDGVEQHEEQPARVVAVLLVFGDLGEENFSEPSN
jgi:hypothetical protein